MWGLGGVALGALTGALGTSAILLCTEVVERAVHRHLSDQARWLRTRDLPVAQQIIAIQGEELEHLQFAERQAEPRRNAWERSLGACIEWATEALIWLSTYGASARLARTMADQNP